LLFCPAALHGIKKPHLHNNGEVASGF